MDIACRCRRQPESINFVPEADLSETIWCYNSEVYLFIVSRPVCYLHTVNCLGAVCVSHLLVEWNRRLCALKSSASLL